MATQVSGVRCGTLRGSHALRDVLYGSCTHSLCAVVRSAPSGGGGMPLPLESFLSSRECECWS